jgi:hypothetical protein
MLIRRMSPVSEKINEMEIDVTEEQMNRWKSGAVLIQDAMPDLTEFEREFIMTGITKDEWTDLFLSDSE